MRTSRVMLIALVSVMVLSVSVWAADELDLKDVKCVLNPKSAAKASTAVDYKGKKVFFCCKNCSGKFEKEPAKYAVAANAQLVKTKQAKQVKCPISGHDIDKDQKAKVDGIEVFFCCGNCQGKVAKAEGKEQMEIVFSDKSFKKGFEIVKAEKK
jgi:YHS domain-containing protein